MRRLGQELRYALGPVVLMTAAGMLATGCGGTQSLGTSERPSVETGRQGVYDYVLGVDPATGAVKKGGTHEVVIPIDRDKPDKIDPPNEPSRLHSALGKETYQIYDPSLKEGKADWDVFPSSWWPQSKNGIAQRWATDNDNYEDWSNPDEVSPAEKYDLLFNPGQEKVVEKVEHWDYRELLKPEDERGKKHSHPKIRVAGPATKWELENHGLYQTFAHPDSWWGHCNGWASYATSEKLGAPKRDIRVRLDGDGKVVECKEGEEGCILFRAGDIEALMTELYFSDSATFAGRRCKTDPDKIERDEYGRPKDAACRDLNPGSFHIAVTGLLSRGAKHLTTQEEGHLAFVIDHNWDWEVWNFPLVRYQIVEQEEVDEAAAAKLVGAEDGKYVFNDKARKWVRIKLNYWMISDGVSSYEMRKPAQERNVSPHKVTLNYVLELDSKGKIIGGEWIEDPQTTWGEDNKKLHPDFFWMPVRHRGWGEGWDDEGGDDDNPYLRYSKVEMLLACANDPATCAPPPAGDSSGGSSSGGEADAGGSSGSGGNEADAGSSSGGSEGGAGGETDASGSGSNAGGSSEPAQPSCAEHCGDVSPVPGSAPSCYCDSSCTTYLDCCPDYEAVCVAPEENPGGSGSEADAGSTTEADAGSTAGESDAGAAADAGPTSEADAGGAASNGGEDAGGSASSGGGNTSGNNTCKNHCGSSDPVPGSAPTCYCDEKCSEYGDCCPDYDPVCTAPPPSGPTCQGHCGSSDPAPGSDPKCYCDELCDQYGDCCDDYAAVCGQ